MTKIGLAGTHRTGKTTLAKAWAARHGCDYVTLSVSKILADMGMTTKQVSDCSDTRLELQQELLRRSNIAFFEKAGSFISDRTPIDIAAYTLADAIEGYYSDAQWSVVQQIVDDCIEITNNAFHCLLMLRPEPSIGYKAEPGKPMPDMAYQMHHSIVIAGLMREEELTVPVQKMRKGKATDLPSRLAVLEHVTNTIITQAHQTEIALLKAGGHVTTLQ